MDRTYELQLQTEYELVMQGERQLDNWNYMDLKPNLREGADFVLVGRQVWYLQCLIAGGNYGLATRVVRRFGCR